MRYATDDLTRLDALVGLVSHELGLVLADLAARVPAGQAIVEVGSYRGKSTCYLAAGARRANAGASTGALGVWAVDAWDSEGNETGRFRYADAETLRAFIDQVRSAGFDEWVFPIRGFSAEVAAEWPTVWSGLPVGLLYLDADHHEQQVRADFDAWVPHLAPGAAVAFDDYSSPKWGVKAVVDALVTAGELLDLRVEADGWLAVTRRP